MKKEQKILVFLTTLWTCVIFGMSLQPAEISSDLSGGLFGWITDHVFPVIWEAMSEKELQMWHTVLRKCAHFTEYLVLGMFWRVTLAGAKCRQKGLTSLGACTVTAAADELLQRFVPGRFGYWKDVLIDSAGAFTGIIIVCTAGVFAYDIFKKIKGRK